MRERKTAPTEGNKSEQNTTISPATGLTPQQEQACIFEKILPSGIESTFGKLDVEFEITPSKEQEKVLTP